MAKNGKIKNGAKIDIYKAWCKGCGICAHFCPKGVLALDEAGHPYVKNPAECGRCGLCAALPRFCHNCPTGRIVRGQVRKGRR